MCYSSNGSKRKFFFCHLRHNLHVISEVGLSLMHMHTRKIAQTGDKKRVVDCNFHWYYPGLFLHGKWAPSEECANLHCCTVLRENCSREKRHFNYPVFYRNLISMLKKTRKKTILRRVINYNISQFSDTKHSRGLWQKTKNKSWVRHSPSCRSTETLIALLIRKAKARQADLAA